MTDTSTAAHQPETFDWHSAGQPEAHHELLKPFEGTFKAEVKMWCGPGEPQQMTGITRNRFVLDGRFLEQHYDGDASGDFGAYVGRGYWGYNRVTRQYEGMWIDNMSTPMMFEAGDVDAAGKVWTMAGTYDDPATGERRNKKSVIRLVSNDHNVMEMYMVDASGNEMKTMEIHYRRV